MRITTPFLTAALSAVLACSAIPAFATDVDGPNDCTKNWRDFGDAPECKPAYPSGVLGKFPTCTFPCTPPGTQELACPPISTVPGPTGFVVHDGLPDHYWLGCYPTPLGPQGVDSEGDGKMNVGGVGVSACAAGLLTDCIEPAFGMLFDQDECYTDGSDAGITSYITFPLCSPKNVVFNTTNCANQYQVFLNICVDWNGDGDWNDNFQCPGVGGCAYEWAVKNYAMVIPPGCATLASPLFLTGPFDNFGWMRISISDNPAPDDYPWNGTVSIPGSHVRGGETEDYPVEITTPTAVNGSTWGRLKVLYR